MAAIEAGSVIVRIGADLSALKEQFDEAGRVVRRGTDEMAKAASTVATPAAATPTSPTPPLGGPTGVEQVAAVAKDVRKAAAEVEDLRRDAERLESPLDGAAKAAEDLSASTRAGADEVASLGQAAEDASDQATDAANRTAQGAREAVASVGTLASAANALPGALGAASAAAQKLPQATANFPDQLRAAADEATALGGRVTAVLKTVQELADQRIREVFGPKNEPMAGAFPGAARGPASPPVTLPVPGGEQAKAAGGREFVKAFVDAGLAELEAMRKSLAETGQLTQQTSDVLDGLANGLNEMAASAEKAGEGMGEFGDAARDADAAAADLGGQPALAAAGGGGAPPPLAAGGGAAPPPTGPRGPAIGEEAGQLLDLQSAVKSLIDTLGDFAKAAQDVPPAEMAARAEEAADKVDYLRNIIALSGQGNDATKATLDSLGEGFTNLAKESKASAAEQEEAAKATETQRKAQRSLGDLLKDGVDFLRGYRREQVQQMRTARFAANEVMGMLPASQAAKAGMAGLVGMMIQGASAGLGFGLAFEAIKFIMGSVTQAMERADKEAKEWAASQQRHAWAARDAWEEFGRSFQAGEARWVGMMRGLTNQIRSEIREQQKIITEASSGSAFKKFWDLITPGDDHLQKIERATRAIERLRGVQKNIPASPEVQAAQLLEEQKGHDRAQREIPVEEAKTGTPRQKLEAQFAKENKEREEKIKAESGRFVLGKEKVGPELQARVKAEYDARLAAIDAELEGVVEETKKTEALRKARERLVAARDKDVRESGAAMAPRQADIQRENIARGKAQAEALTQSDEGRELAVQQAKTNAVRAGASQRIQIEQAYRAEMNRISTERKQAQRVNDGKGDKQVLDRLAAEETAAKKNRSSQIALLGIQEDYAVRIAAAQWDAARANNAEEQARLNTLVQILGIEQQIAAAKAKGEPTAALEQQRRTVEASGGRAQVEARQQIERDNMVEAQRRQAVYAGHELRLQMAEDEYQQALRHQQELAQATLDRVKATRGSTPEQIAAAEQGVKDSTDPTKNDAVRAAERKVREARLQNKQEAITWEAERAQAARQYSRDAIEAQQRENDARRNLIGGDILGMKQMSLAVEDARLMEERYTQDVIDAEARLEAARTKARAAGAEGWEVEAAPEVVQAREDVQRVKTTGRTEANDAQRAKLREGYAGMVQDAADWGQRIGNVLGSAIAKGATPIKAIVAMMKEMLTGVLEVIRKQVLANAVAGASEAAKANAGVPGVGPALAAGAMSAMLSLIMGLITLLPSAAGGWQIPKGVNPVLQAHSGEHVIPESLAQKYEEGAPGQQKALGSQLVASVGGAVNQAMAAAAPGGIPVVRGTEVNAVVRAPQERSDSGSATVAAQAAAQQRAAASPGADAGGGRTANVTVNQTIQAWDGRDTRRALERSSRDVSRAYRAAIRRKTV